jgi:hypothetical protein
MNALQTLSLNAPVQDLMMNHIMSALLNGETQREWELITSPRADTPTTAELITFWNLDAELWSYCRLHSHQGQLLPLHGPHNQQATRLVSILTPT